MDSEPLTIAGHHAWRESITATDPRFDEVDLALENDEIDPLLLDRPPQRRSGKQTNRVLDILDQIAGEQEGWAK